jgi:branched-chain amino acid transport system permease protein
MSRKRKTLLSSGAVFLTLLSVPHFVSDYHIYLLNEIFILALMGYSFKILFGAGYLSLGIAGFYAVGAYAFALFYFHITKSFYLAFFGAVILSGIVSSIIGFFCVKRKKMYFAVLTFAFSELIHATMWQWRGLFGGDEGISGVARPPLDFYFFQVSLQSYLNFYYFTLAVLVICICLLWKVQNSNFGYILKSIHDNPERAAFVGVNVQNHVLVAFVMSGILAGLAGALYVCLSGAVDPEFAHIINTVEPQIATLVGGVSTFGGPFVGSMIYLLIKAYLITKIGNWVIVIGALLIGLVLLFRRGILGYVSERAGLEV